MRIAAGCATVGCANPATHVTVVNSLDPRSSSAALVCKRCGNGDASPLNDESDAVKRLLAVEIHAMLRCEPESHMSQRETKRLDALRVAFASLEGQ